VPNSIIKLDTTSGAAMEVFHAIAKIEEILIDRAATAAIDSESAAALDRLKTPFKQTTSANLPQHINTPASPSDRLLNSQTKPETLGKASAQQMSESMNDY